MGNSRSGMLFSVIIYYIANRATVYMVFFDIMIHHLRSNIPESQHNIMGMSTI